MDRVEVWFPGDELLIDHMNGLSGGDELMPAIPQIPTIDTKTLVVMGILIGVYVLWFAWGVMKAEIPEDPYIKARKQKPSAAER